MKSGDDENLAAGLAPAAPWQHARTILIAAAGETQCIAVGKLRALARLHAVHARLFGSADIDAAIDARVARGAIKATPAPCH